MLIKIISILIIAMGLFLIINDILERKKCINVVEGKVIKILEEKAADSSTGIYFTPVFEYIVNSQKYIHESQIGDTNNKYFVGQDVKLYYNPSNPSQCYEENLPHTYIIVLGIVCIINGFFNILFF